MDKGQESGLNRESFSDAKVLCEEFARLKGYTVKLVKEPWRRFWLVRLRYGRYSLKFFDGPLRPSPKKAYEAFAERLCDPDRWFFPGKFNGWSHFGQCSGLAELAMKMAIYGED
jgi:hypothetical protein